MKVKFHPLAEWCLDFNDASRTVAVLLLQNVFLLNIQ
jgi:hypothetical protein